MRLQRINCRAIWYAPYADTEHLVSAGEDYRTGERVSSYGKPTRIDRINVSAAMGNNVVADFGSYNDYSVTIVTQDMTCPITERSLLWLDRDPAVDSEGYATVSHDYIVRHVARTINTIAYAAAEVETAGQDEIWQESSI